MGKRISSNKYLLVVFVVLATVSFVIYMDEEKDDVKQTFSEQIPSASYIDEAVKVTPNYAIQTEASPTAVPKKESQVIDLSLEQEIYKSTDLYPIALELIVEAESDNPRAQ